MRLALADPDEEVMIKIIGRFGEKKKWS